MLAVALADAGRCDRIPSVRCLSRWARSGRRGNARGPLARRQLHATVMERQDRSDEAKSSLPGHSRQQQCARNHWCSHEECPMSESVAIRYRAFLSYAHADASWARWLHYRLEHFVIDKKLQGRITLLGPVPKELSPIFRDRDDFSGGQSLTDATIAALDQSAALIVLCSTIAASAANS